MKTKIRFFTAFAALAIGGPLVFTPTYVGAQTKENVDVNVNIINKDGNVHVKIVTTVNGKRVVKDTTFKAGTINIEDYIQQNTPAGNGDAIPGEKKHLIIRSDEKVIRMQRNDMLLRPIEPGREPMQADSFFLDAKRMELIQLKGNPPVLHLLQPLLIPQPGDNLEIRELPGNMPVMFKIEGLDTAKMKIIILEEIKNLPNDAEMQKLLMERGIELPEGAIINKEVRMIIIQPAKIENLNVEEIQQLKENDVDFFDNKKMLPAEDVLFIPNPNDGRFLLSFNLPEKGRSELRIMDMQGKIVYEEKLGNFQGNYQREIDISKESKGIYLLQVLQGQKILQKKIVIQQ